MMINDCVGLLIVYIYMDNKLQGLEFKIKY